MKLCIVCMKYKLWIQLCLETYWCVIVVHTNLFPFLFGNDCCCFQEDLDALQGMKCQAPYKHDWGDVSYHNALVCAVEPTSSVHSMNQIQVLVCS